MNTTRTEIIFFGRLEERKGLLEFLEAVVGLPSGGTQGFSVTFVGKDVRLYSLRTGRVSSGEYIRREMAGCDHPFRTLTDLSSEEAVGYVRASPSCIVCLASPSDNFPNAALEMAQIAAPLVVSDTTGFHQTLELAGRRDAVFWFKPGSAASLRAALGQALAAVGTRVTPPATADIEATNQSLTQKRFELIEEAFAKNRPDWLATNWQARVFILADGDSQAAEATLRSLAKADTKIVEFFILTMKPWTEDDQTRLQNRFPHGMLRWAENLYQALTLPPGDAPATTPCQRLLFIRAGTTVQPETVRNFIEAGVRTNAAMVTAAEFYGPHQEKIRAFSPGSVPQLLRSNNTSGACVLVSQQFVQSLPPLTAPTPAMLIWQLTLAAAATGEKIAYIPYPQYAAKTGETSSSVGEDQLVSLSRYAAAIETARWTRREIFGLALSVQQLSENLRQVRAETNHHVAHIQAKLAQAESHCAQVRSELAAVYSTKSWRVTAPLRYALRGLSAVKSRLINASHRLSMNSLRQRILDSPRLNPPMQDADLFHPLAQELGQHAALLKGRVLNAGAGNRDISAFVEGELTNQDIPQGLHNANIHILSPLHEIPREDGYFDVIFCNAVLEHVSNPDEIVAEFARVCRPGGHLYLAVPFMQPEHKDPTDFQRYTADGLVALVQRHGFVAEKVEPLHNVYTTLGWLVCSWLSASRCLRNVLLNWLLFQPLRYLSQHGREQVFATASAYRVIARRDSNDG